LALILALPALKLGVPAAMRLGVLDDQPELVPRVLLRLRDELRVGVRVLLADLVDEELVRVAVLVGEKDHAPGRQPVAPGAAGLLVIGLQRSGQVVMRHQPHVRLVDPHANALVATAIARGVFMN